MWDVTFQLQKRGDFFWISTHTSRVGCDADSVPFDTVDEEFLLTHPVWDVTGSDLLRIIIIRISTHTSRVGCDEIASVWSGGYEKFLLTHPVWDVTFALIGGREKPRNFYSHIPCGM